MDTAAPSPSPAPAAPLTPCPGCRAPLISLTECARCSLPLVGPDAARLGEIDADLTRLESARARLWSERVALLDRLYRSRTILTPALPTQAPGSEELLPSWPAALDPARVEVGSRSVQNTLLTLGALLLGAAALVFAAVSYGQLGPGGRAVVVALLTALTAGALPLLLRRSLPAAAESFAAVWLALALSELTLLRQAGAFPDLEARTYVSWGVAGVALLSAALATWLPLRLLRVAAPLLVVVPALGLTSFADLAPGLDALLLAGVCAPLALLVLQRGFPGETRAAGCVSLGILAFVASSSALATIINLTPAHTGGLGLLPGAITPAWTASFLALTLLLLELGVAAWQTASSRPALSSALSATAGVGVLVLVCLTGFSLLSTEPSLLLPPLLSLTALLMLALSTHPSPRRLPFALVGAAGVGLALLTQLHRLLPASLGHLLMDEPWRIESLATPLADLSPIMLSDRLGLALLLALLPVLAAALLARALPALASSLRSAALLWTGFLVPVVLNAAGASLGMSLLVLALLVLALLGLAAALTRTRLEVLASMAGLGATRLGVLLELTALGLALHLLALSGANEAATLVVLPLLAALAALRACDLRSLLPVSQTSPLPEAVGTPASAPDTTATFLLASALALAVGWVLALGTAPSLGLTLETPQLGALLLPLVLVLTATPLLRRLSLRKQAPGQAMTGTPLPRRLLALALAADIVVIPLGLLSLTLTVGDPGWFSWALAALGVGALVRSLLASSIALAHLGALLLAASSWVRLVEAEIEIVEFYTVPLALLVLGLGVLRARANPALSSINTLSSGLSLLLVPTSLVALGDADLTRPLLLLVLSALVLASGVLMRLRAPLLWGAAALLLDTIHLVGPWALNLPRALSLGVLGAALLAGGVRYEQMRRTASKVRASIEALD